MTIPDEFLEAMTGGGTVVPRVSRKEALSVPAVFRARNLIAGTMGSLPHDSHDPEMAEVTDTYLMTKQIDPDIPNAVVLSQLYEDLFFEGISWFRVIDRGWHGYPTHARHVPVESVHVASLTWTPAEGWVSLDHPIPENGRIFIDGIPVPDSEVIRFDSSNPPILTHGARAIRQAIELDRTAARFAANPQALGYFAPAEGVDPGTREEIQEMLDEWETARTQRAWGYIGAALKAHELSWTPEQLQLHDARQHAVLEIARLTGIDPEDLGVSTTSRTYMNAEQQRLNLIDFTFAPYASAVEDRLSMRDVLPRGYTTKVDFTGFARGDLKGRMEAAKIGIEIGVFTPQDVQKAEGLPINVIPKPTPAPAPKPTPQPAPQGQPSYSRKDRDLLVRAAKLAETEGKLDISKDLLRVALELSSNGQ